MDFQQKFEPKGRRIIHGAGQSPEQFKKYWHAVGDYKPLMYMQYIRLGEIKEKLLEKIEMMESISPTLCLQLGFNLKPRNEQEKCKEIAQECYDEELMQLIELLKNLKNPVFLRIGYECNDPAHNYHPHQFILAWRYIVDAFRKHQVNNVAMVWSVCTAFNRTVSELMRYYPGDAYVDWFSDDLFGVRHFTEKNNPAIITEHFYREAERHRKPMMIGESSAVHSGVDKGEKSWDAWFKPYFQWIASHPNVKAFCYINWDWGKDWKQPAWGNCRIEENTDIQEHYTQELSSSKYLHHQRIKTFLNQVYDT